MAKSLNRHGWLRRRPEKSPLSNPRVCTHARSQTLYVYLLRVLELFVGLCIAATFTCMSNPSKLISSDLYEIANYPPCPSTVSFVARRIRISEREKAIGNETVSRVDHTELFKSIRVNTSEQVFNLILEENS